MSSDAYATRSSSPADSAQYLTFRLGDEDYGIPILRVQEIRGVPSVTRLAGAPIYVSGVMNLRGSVTPVIDLRARLGLPQSELTKQAVTIIVGAAGRLVGWTVDAVSEVQSIAASTIEPPPPLGSTVDTSYLSGIAKVEERLIALLDIDCVFGLEPKTD
ncbi:MAG: purine-binding chemotaxis protein CheW [Planctomycetes bacterium]|nr:purine-binding chemotaxis protein CheW [Planctomycetota bacterium]